MSKSHPSHGNGRAAAQDDAPLVAIRRYRPPEAAVGFGEGLGGTGFRSSAQPRQPALGVPWWLLEQDPATAAGLHSHDRASWEAAQKVRATRVSSLFYKI